MLRRISIVTDVPRMEIATDGRDDIDLTVVSENIFRFSVQCFKSDIVILEDSSIALFVACCARMVQNFKLISVDVVLRRPADSFVAKLKARVKRCLLGRVDRFLLYFRDIRGYRRFYGIDQSRTVYVPFKANSLSSSELSERDVSDSGIVLCAGRSMRDVATFAEAMRMTGLPGILVQQNPCIVAEHGTQPWRQEALASNVRLVIDQADDLYRYMAAARLVVIPRYRSDINATGISLYLSAMALGKCVILSRGPGAEDLLDSEAALVEPENPAALANLIKQLYCDHSRRRLISQRGQQYAASLGNEERLLKDVLAQSLACIKAT